MTKTIKNITSCTHCGDTYSVDDALGLDMILKRKEIEECFETNIYSENYAHEKAFDEFAIYYHECLNCKNKYVPLDNFRPVTMDLWIYDALRRVKG